jgi:hypothetical protein
MIEFENGTLRVSASYSLKIPADVQYASEDAAASLSVEQEVTAGSLEEVNDKAQLIYEALAANAKLMVLAQLSVDFDTTAGEVIRPKIRPPRHRSNGSQQRKQSASSSGSREKRGGGGSRRDLPVVEIEGDDYYDQRTLIADGTFKSTAPAFTPVKEGHGRPLWLYAKSGDLNQDVADMLDEAGIDY